MSSGRNHDDGNGQLTMIPGYIALQTSRITNTTFLIVNKTIQSIAIRVRLISIDVNEQLFADLLVS